MMVYSCSHTHQQINEDTHIVFCLIGSCCILTCVWFCGVLQLFVTMYLPECFVASTRELPQQKPCLIKICLRACSHSQDRGRGSHFDFCPRPCSSTCRWARLATHRHIGPHFVCIPCSHAHLGLFTTACVSAPKRLGASTSGRTDSFV